MRYKAIQAATYGSNEIMCAHCGELFGRKDIQVDHIEPLIRTNESSIQNWKRYIEELFYLDINVVQVLCKPCHKEKSRQENEERRKKND